MNYKKFSSKAPKRKETKVKADHQIRSQCHKPAR
jgi:hypothetical protein